MTEKVRLVATARLIVDGRRLVNGDAFEALERAAARGDNLGSITAALGFARRARPPVVVPPVVAKPAVVTKVVTAQADAAGQDEPKATGRGRYARRDLRAAT